ncbi:multidrug efflux system protein [Haemophilus influenzae]|uniref:Multidrug efflux system protein n=1 Tax=Haemophilus influenzae TaxID=727 RepID=A0A2X1QPG1_HAEIF|nr:multidrug efflux system protein [Haemophilus influenzae]
MSYRNKVETTTKSVEQLSNLIISSNGDDLVRLRDIATVELNKENDNSRATANGAESVVLAINPTSTANPFDCRRKNSPFI